MSDTNLRFLIATRRFKSQLNDRSDWNIDSMITKVIDTPGQSTKFPSAKACKNNIETNFSCELTWYWKVIEKVKRCRLAGFERQMNNGQSKSITGMLEWSLNITSLDLVRHYCYSRPIFRFLGSQLQTLHLAFQWKMNIEIKPRRFSINLIFIIQLCNADNILLTQG